MTDRQLIQLAARTLHPDLFVVWLQRNIEHIGRRKGARLLEITEGQWRYREQQAERIMGRAIETTKETAA